MRVLREAGIGIALLLMIIAFSTLAPHFTDESNINEDNPLGTSTRNSFAAEQHSVTVVTGNGVCLLTIGVRLPIRADDSYLQRNTWR